MQYDGTLALLSVQLILTLTCARNLLFLYVQFKMLCCDDAVFHRTSQVWRRNHLVTVSGKDYVWV